MQETITPTAESTFSGKIQTVGRTVSRHTIQEFGTGRITLCAFAEGNTVSLTTPDCKGSKSGMTGMFEYKDIKIKGQKLLLKQTSTVLH